MNRDILKRILDSKVEHVCIDGYQNLSSGNEFTLQILTPNRKDFCTVANLETIPGSKCDFRCINDTSMLFRIIEKGNGAFPDKFEAELIYSRVVYSELVWVPDLERRFWMNMYQMVIHQGSVPDRYHHCLQSKLRERVGVTACTKPEYGFGDHAK